MAGLPSFIGKAFSISSGAGIPAPSLYAIALGRIFSSHLLNVPLIIDSSFIKTVIIASGLNVPL